MESFIKIAGYAGVDLSFIYEGSISIHFGNLNPDPDKKGKTIAVAWGSENDNSVHIEVDTKVWNRLTPLERTATMYHELAHDILNASHNKETEGHLMHPYNQFESEAQLVEAMFMLFQEYKDGTMMIFNENTSY